MFDILNIKEYKWKEGDSIIREFEPEFKHPNLEVLAQLLKVISRDIEFYLLKDIDLLSNIIEKEQYSDDKWGIWNDESKDWEKSLPLHFREETGYQLGEIVTVFSGDYLPYVFYRPKDNMILIVDYYKKISIPIELSLDEMKSLLLCWANKVRDIFKNKSV